MNLKHTIVATAAVALIALACGDVPAGSDQGDSAGDNQPGKACELTVGAGGSEPLARFTDGQFVYDVWVELWDEDCTSASLADHGGAPDGKLIKPVHVFLHGEINGQTADYMGTAREQDVNTPWHARGFVSPRNTPHQLSVVADVNRDARSWVAETLGDGFIHCRIWRDGAPIPTAKGSRDRVTHTVPLIDGRGQANCHFFVGVG